LTRSEGERSSHRKRKEPDERRERAGPLLGKKIRPIARGGEKEGDFVTTGKTTGSSRGLISSAQGARGQWKKKRGRGDLALSQKSDPAVLFGSEGKKKWAALRTWKEEEQVRSAGEARLEALSKERDRRGREGRTCHRGGTSDSRKKGRGPWGRRRGKGGGEGRSSLQWIRRSQGIAIRSPSERSSLVPEEGKKDLLLRCQGLDPGTRISLIREKEKKRLCLVERGEKGNLSVIRQAKITVLTSLVPGFWESRLGRRGIGTFGGIVGRGGQESPEPRHRLSRG